MNQPPNSQYFNPGVGQPTWPGPAGQAFSQPNVQQPTPNFNANKMPTKQNISQHSTPFPGVGGIMNGSGNAMNGSLTPPSSMIGLSQPNVPAGSQGQFMQPPIQKMTQQMSDVSLANKPQIQRTPFQNGPPQGPGGQSYGQPPFPSSRPPQGQNNMTAPLSSIPPPSSMGGQGGNAPLSGPLHGGPPSSQPFIPSSSGQTFSSGPPSGPPSGLSSGPPTGPPTGPPSARNMGPPTGPLSGPPTGYPTGPPSGPPIGPPSGPPTGPLSGPLTGPPSGPPTGPPSGPPTGPPSGPPTGPPSGPPTGAPTGFPSGPSFMNPMGQPSSQAGMFTGPPSAQVSGPPPAGRRQHPAPGGQAMPPMGGPSIPGQSYQMQGQQMPANSLSGPMMSGPSGMAGPPISSQPPRAATGPPVPGQGGFQQQPNMPPSSQHLMSGPMQQQGLPGRQGIPGRPGMHGQMPGGSGPINSPMQQPAKRIDPDQMPSPIQVMKDDAEAYKGQTFQTSTRGKLPPLVTTNCKIQDDGNCSARFMRSTLYSVPCNQDMLKESNLPLAMMINPFAKIPEGETPMYFADHGPSGPVRCNRCKAYMNPFMQFIDGGRRFVCNICSHSSEVPSEYFCHLDHQGRRVDVYERPELCFGSYEFIATQDYCKDGKLPSPPAFIFMIDVSYQSMQCGMVRLLTKELHTLLDQLPKDTGHEESLIKVGFVTYSNHLHFYNVKENLAQPQMMVVSDLNDVFVPLLDGFLVSIKEARIVVDSLLEQIPELFHDTRETDIVLGPVVQAGMEALKAAGIAGKLFVFHSSLPIAEAPGKLKNREDRKLLATDKEKTILAPQSNFYVNLAKDCVSNGVSVDLFLFPNGYVDVATIGLLVTQTGGQIYRYSYFKEATHGPQFIEDLKKNLAREVGFDAIMRLRCSTGLRPVEFYGSFLMNNTTDIELASLDSDKAIVIEIKHDDKIPEDGVAFAQCALLYTSVSGQRRLRIHNLAFSCCSQLSDLYRCCDLDTLMNFFTKNALRQVLTSNPQTIREGLANRTAHILACYRQHCASPSTSGQLILPECMKLLPVYTGSLLKCDVLAGGSEMSSDDRAFLMQAVLSMSTVGSVPYLYPRLFALHDGGQESTELPQQLRCSIDRMDDSGIYLLENGISMFIWIGLQVSPDILRDLFQVNTIGQVDIEMTSLPELDTKLSKRVRSIIAAIQSERQRYLKLTIVRQRDKLEPWFKHYLVEDKGFHVHHMSYVDFLCHIHKEIRNLLN